jgi:hypothetical protein
VELSPILVIVIILVAAAGAGRTLAQLGLASDLMASLFVPPDRALGWPHGVQEQDVAWTWRAPQSPTDPAEATSPVPTQRLVPIVGRGSSLPGGRRVRR